MGVAARALALAALVGAPGCFWFTTKQEGANLKKDVTDLKGRMAKQEQSLDARLLELNDTIEKAKKHLAAAGADVGAEVADLRGELAKLNGRIGELVSQLEVLGAEVVALRSENARLKEELETRVTANEARLDALEKKTSGPTQLDKDALWDSAQAKLKAGQLTDARKELKDFIKKFPNDARADDAQLALGDIYMKEKQPEKALGEYQKLRDTYPNSDLHDQALWNMGLAAIEIKWCIEAQSYLATLISDHPKSPLVKQAKEKLDWLKKNLKNKKVCPT